ncbi:MAG: tetratricopeptide repeat protein [Tepidisphaeraceae bacterium]|jgi:tetratricopeptide (TPR) repeat protein
MTAIPIQQALQTAATHQNAGRYPQAESIYRQILAQHPDSHETLHLLGVLASQVGRNDVAYDLLKRAITLSPNSPDYQGNFGLICCNLGKNDEGVAAYRRAIALRPDYPEALSNLGNVLRSQFNAREAAEVCRRATELRPNFAEAWNNLGNAYSDLRMFNQAIDSYKKALALKPDFAQAVNNLGGALQDVNKIEEAIACYRKALVLSPNYADAYNNLAHALNVKGDNQESLEMCRKAIQLRAEFPEAYNMLGNTLNDLQRPYEAVEALRHAIALRPEYAEAHNNLGNSYYELDRIDEAMDEYRLSLKYNPNYFQALNNYGNALHSIGQLDEAIEYCRRAVRLRPSFPAAHWNLALVQLIRGDYQEGWEEYEWRWKVKELRPPKLILPKDAWTNQDIRGKKLVVYVEQGYGDTIQFVRFLPMVQEMGAKIFLFVQPNLVRLLKNFEVADEILPTEGVPVTLKKDFRRFHIGGSEIYPTDGVNVTLPFDYHIPLLSLPRKLGITVEKIPRDIPYVFADPTDVEKWKSRVPKDGRLKVGIAWAGRPSHANDRKRTISLSSFAPLAEAKNVWFCSLQKGSRAQEIRNPPPGMEIVDWTDELNDFADTAGLMANLDLIISVDTAVVHLAGAMGKEAWVLIPFMPDWRWMLNREDSPWYPSLRLFRQPKLFDYDTPISQMAQALQCKTQNKS